MDSINLNKENGLKLWATDWNKLISTINLIIDKINTQEGGTSITKLSQLINDSGFITEEDVSGKANKSELARVATSGSYNDLIDKPSQEASAQGPEGKSAYQVAVDNGFVGTEQEWLASLKGEAGQNGLNGASGLDGAPGQDGSDGKSAYELAVQLGYEGTLELWLLSLHGQNGLNGQDGSPGQNGLNGITPHIDSSTKHWFIGETDTNIVAEGLNGQNGVNGTDGKSAYLSYVDTTSDNPVLTEQQWVVSLQGTNGTNGNDGNDGVTPTVTVTTISNGHNVAFSYGTGDSRNTNFDVMDGNVANQLQADWDLTDNTQADYIKNKPTIPATPVLSNWNETNTSSLAYIANKPTIPSTTGMVTSSTTGLKIEVVASLPASPDANTIYIVQ